MTGERASRVEAAFSAQNGTPSARSLCTTSADVLEVSAVGVTLMSASYGNPVCSSDDRAASLDELQYSLGEGPSPDAYSSRRPVFEPELGSSSQKRWPNFTPPALDSGTRAVFAFPLHAGKSCIGVLTLYQDDPGSLTPAQAADGLLVADTVVQSMLAIQSQSDGKALADELTATFAHRAEVHQASGMIAVQLDIDVWAASARLRAHAYATNRPVADIALDIVERRLRLDDDRLTQNGAD